jgi:hypothetical protein
LLGVPFYQFGATDDNKKWHFFVIVYIDSKYEEKKLKFKMSLSSKTEYMVLDEVYKIEF